MTALAAAARAADYLKRIPKVALFATAALIQVALIAVMVVDRVQILRQGVEVKLQARPVDPRDLLRGDYVVLGYDISQIPAGPLKGQPAGTSNPVVYVELAPNREGLFEAVSVHTEAIAVTSPEVLIRGRVTSGAACGPKGLVFCDKLTVRYDLERYFVPEGEGKNLEQARNLRKLTVVAAVAPSGRAAIKRLLVDGEPFYDEPWF